MRLRLFGFIAAAIFLFKAGAAAATPMIVIDVATGDVLFEDHATERWYPASLTKLMTVYVALSAVRDHRISLDTPLVVSRRAAAMPPSKMGFRPGTEVTLGNALKMLMVKSPNDLAVTIAEGVAGSVEAFAEDMNADAAKLGMRQSHFANPNGLQNPEHYSSARDLAVLGRALYLTFPQYAGLFDIGAIRLGDKIIPNHNDMLGRYPGVNGMKTGFTCDAGFNLVASATRNGHHYISVVLGAPTARTRLIRSAVLLDRAFDGVDRPHPMAPDEPVGGAPADMRAIVCHRRSKAIASFEAETDRLEGPLTAVSQPSPGSPAFNMFSASALARETPVALRIALLPAPVFDPEPVYIGPTPGYTGPVAEARPPHSPIGTPPVAEAAPAPAVQTPAGEPNEDTPDLSGKDAAVASSAPIAPKHHAEHHRRHARAKATAHAKVAKTTHGHHHSVAKHSIAKTHKPAKSRLSRHEHHEKQKSAEAGKHKGKSAAVKGKTRKFAAKARARRAAESEN